MNECKSFSTASIYLNEQKDLIHDKVVLSQGFFTKIVMGDGKGVYKDSGQIMLSNVG